MVLPQSPALFSLCSMRSFCFTAHLTFVRLRASKGADKTGTSTLPAGTLRTFLVLSRLQLSYWQNFLLWALLQWCDEMTFVRNHSLPSHSQAMLFFAPAPALNLSLPIEHGCIIASLTPQPPLSQPEQPPSHPSFLCVSQATSQAGGNGELGTSLPHQRCSRIKTSDKCLSSSTPSTMPPSCLGKH